MQVHNTHGGGLTLPNGQHAPAGGEVDVKPDDWKAMQTHPVVKGWVDTGMLSAKSVTTKAETPAKPAPVPDLDKMSDDDLRSFIESKDGKADGRWQRERLLDEARKLSA